MITAGPRSPGRGPPVNQPAIDASGGTATLPSASNPTATSTLSTPIAGIDTDSGSPTGWSEDRSTPGRTTGWPDEAVTGPSMLSVEAGVPDEGELVEQLVDDFLARCEQE